MKAIVVADVGINASGDINAAKKMIDIAKLSGVDFMKFQKRTVKDVYSKDELDKYRESPFGTTNREQKNGIEFGKDEYDEIDRYCKKKKIPWYASAWDIKSVDFLMEYDVPYMKIASTGITNIPLLKKIAETQKPVIISTGMSDQKEIDNCLEIVGDNVEYILSCTATYPSQIEDMNMNKIRTLQKLYGDKYKIGFSNHSPGIIFVLMAYVLGSEMLEYHMTLDRTSYGSDQASSFEISGMLKIKKYLDAMRNGWGNGKIECLPSEIPIRKKLRGE